MDMRILLYNKHIIQSYKHCFLYFTKEYGFSQLEIDVLLFLYNNPTLNSAQDIVDYRGFSKSNVSNAIDSLRKSGYLISNVDPENRRIQRLFLVKSKENVIKKIAECQLTFLEEITKGFSSNDLIIIDKYLKHIDENAIELLNKAEII